MSRRRPRGRVLWVAALIAAVLATTVAVVATTSFGDRVIGRNSCTATVNGSTAHLTSAQARYAALIAAGSIRHGMPPRAATIALATALQESDLENLDHGHADSLGLFQQRPSMGWGTAEQIQDPYYATDRFYQALARVEGYTTMSITDAAQRVQISAYGQAYAQHERRSRILASALTGQTAAAFTCTNVTAGHGSADQVAGHLEKAFGIDATASGGAVTVVVRSAVGGASAQRARWAVAAWAIANTGQAPITSVSTSGRTWTSDRATWADDANAPARAVVIRLGSRG